MRECIKIDLDGIKDKLLEDADEVVQVSERVRIADFGLAAPLFGMRQQQMQREIARVAAHKGSDHPEVVARQASLERTAARRQLFDADLSRERIDQPTLDTKNGAGVYGRIVEAGQPVEGVTVIAYAGDERLDFRCTDDNGSFAMEIPVGGPVILSVADKEKNELYRDTQPMSLKPKEQRFREIDLSSTKPPCPDPGEDPGDTIDLVTVPNVIGQPEAEAVELLGSAGLTIGEISHKIEPNQVGIVLAQTPQAGAEVERGSPVELVIGAGVEVEVEVPVLTKLKLAEATVRIRESELELGSVTERDVPQSLVGLVINQDPQAGSRVPRSATVDLEVGKATGQTDPVDKPPSVKAIATTAETELRKKRFRQQEAEGWLLVLLEDASIDSVKKLDRLLAANLVTARKLLPMGSKAEAAQILAALKTARSDEDK